MMNTREWIETEMPNMEGWCSITKAKKMAEIVHDIKPNVTVEIGVFAGRSLFAIAKALEEFHTDGEVWGIDPWVKSSVVEGNISQIDKDWWDALDLNSFYDYTLKHMLLYEVEPWIHLLREKSEEVLDKFDSIDFLHIDGNHSEEASVRDVKNYVPKVREGGIIIMDDIGWPTTFKAQEILKTMADEIFVYDNSKGEKWAVYKKKGVKDEEKVQEERIEENEIDLF